MSRLHAANFLRRFRLSAAVAICATACATVAIVLVACDAERRSARAPAGDGSPPRLVFLFAPCTVQAAKLSPYDPSVVSTPRLAEFAREAITFRRHQSESGQSGTAFAAMFTGTQADRHGVFHHPSPLTEDVDTVGEVFARAGYEVHAWLAQVMASADLGYGQGAPASHQSELALTTDDARFLDLLARLRRDPSARALVVFHFTLTHAPYQVAPVATFCDLYPDRCAALHDDPEAFRQAAGFYSVHHAELSQDFPDAAARWQLEGGKLRYLRRVVDLLYEANIARLDYHFGALLDVIRDHGLWPETLVAFTADHGETLFRDGTLLKWTHGHQLAPEVLQVPLLIRAPGLEPGAYDGVSRSIDLLPTLAGLTGIDGPSYPGGADPEGFTTGIDLSPHLGSSDRAAPPPLLAFSHTSLVSKVVHQNTSAWALFQQLYPRVDPELMWAQVRDHDQVFQIRRDLDGRWREAVYDLAADPHQLEDLRRPGDAVQDRRLAQVRAYRQRLIDAEGRFRQRRSADETEDAWDQNALELLRSLGYVEDAADGAAEPSPEPSSSPSPPSPSSSSAGFR